MARIPSTRAGRSDPIPDPPSTAQPTAHRLLRDTLHAGNHRQLPDTRDVDSGEMLRVLYAKSPVALAVLADDPLEDVQEERAGPVADE